MRRCESMTRRASRGLVRARGALRRGAVCAADWVLEQGDEVTTRDARGVVFRPRYDWLTLVRAAMPVMRDARGRGVVIATSRMHHLARHRRERLWSVRAAIGHDMRAVMRRTRWRASAGLVAAAGVMYGVLGAIDTGSAAAVVKMPLAIAGLACVGAACLTWLLEPHARLRRRIVLSHARCACCLETVTRDARSDVTRCTLCEAAWPSDEVGEADGEHHRCDACAYDLSGVHESHCPECGAATGRLQRAA